jgi:multidrug efflux pump subunit AcrA (membrane-fusion protein)
MDYTIMTILLASLFTTAFCAEGPAPSSRKLPPSAEKRIAEINVENAIRDKCMEKYGQAIRTQSETISKKLMLDLQQEQTLLKTKYEQASDLKQLKSQMEALRPLQTQDTGLVKMKQQKAHIDSLQKKMSKAESRIQNDADVRKIRVSIGEKQKQIDQIIQEIVKNDPECRQCLVMRNKISN